MHVKRIGLLKGPLEVRVEGSNGVYFLRIWKNGSLQIRPKGARKPEASALVTVGSVYRRALLLVAKEAKPQRRHSISRGMIATERGAI